MSSLPLVLVPTRFESEILFGPQKKVPATCEAGGREFQLAWPGFGVVAAAALTTHWLQRLRPERVLLVGIAGTLHPEQLLVGHVFRPSTVRCHGVGAGEGEEFEPLPFPQVPTELMNPPVHEVLALHGAADSQGELLTVTSAAAGPADAQRRRTQYPTAMAEDMEAFGVALAAGLYRVPLTVLRGISNVAGERDKGQWDVHGALKNLQGSIQEWLEEATP